MYIETWYSEHGEFLPGICDFQLILSPLDEEAVSILDIDMLYRFVDMLPCCGVLAYGLLIARLRCRFSSDVCDIFMIYIK